MFACLYGGKVGLKLPEVTANEARGKEGNIGLSTLRKTENAEWIQFDFDSEEELRRYR